jgi:hypothetical protein
MRCPARVPRKHAPGGWRSPSGPTTGLCLEWLDGTAKGGRNPAGVSSSEVTCWPGRTVLPPKIAAVARPQAPRFAAMRIASQPPTQRACRRAASPHGFEGRIFAHLGRPAPREGRAASVRHRSLKTGCLTFESYFRGGAAGRRRDGPDQVVSSASLQDTSVSRQTSRDFADILRQRPALLIPDSGRSAASGLRGYFQRKV